VSIEGMVTEGYPNGTVSWGANLAMPLMFYSRSIRQNEQSGDAQWMAVASARSRWGLDVLIL
jgi:hypothetical protein